jgi:hypothetical protein
MRRLARFLSRPFADHRLLLQSVVALAGIRLGLSLLRFETLRRAIDRLSRVRARQNQPQWRLVRKVVWSVNVVSTYLPLFKNCLNRALATQLLLGRRGQLVDVRIGVGRDPKGAFKAHAWIESEGRIVLGHVEDLPELTPLPPLTLRNVRS